MHQVQKLPNVEKAVDQIIEKLGPKIVVGTPLAAGKPNHLINALYQRAKKNKKIDLTICTALTLERPKPTSDLERRFLGPFEQRVFGDYPDLQYEMDRVKKKLPKNIQVIEFYLPPGKFLHNQGVQRHYLSSNYTHVCRDMLDRGVNLLLQMVATKGDQISLSCNADVTADLIPRMRKQTAGKCLAVGQVNQNLPFMYGDANISEDVFDILVDNPDQYYRVFGPPKMSIPDVDFMIGLYASSLVKDDGELQVGIGSLGDAFIYALVLRQTENEIYQSLLSELNSQEKYGPLMERLGGQETFATGLFGATEMMVDGFKELYENKILKKKVYDDLELQRLINKGLLNPNQLNDSIFQQLLDHRMIQLPLDSKEFAFLQYWGILKDHVTFPEVANIKEQVELYPFRGEKLKHGHLVHGGFFLGPNSFYTWLRELPEAERKLFAMKSVLKINQLYGHEELDRLHRKNARFVNTCMMTTFSGAHVSDGLEDGKVVSGVGGQFNFVAMAQELPDGHSVITMRSTRTKNGKVFSNIVDHYGHITVPRHMRDILVTEYGVAFLRGKTDEEIIQELAKVCDSRFQPKLIATAKKLGKLNKSYKLPEAYANNFPKSYQSILSHFKKQGLFSPFPFGTDLTETEIKLGGALKRVKARKQSGLIATIKLLSQAFKTIPNAEQLKLLERLDLHQPQGLKEKFYQKLVCTELT